MAPVFHQVLNGSVPPGTPNCLDESLRLPDRTEIHNFLKWNPKWNPRADFGTICGTGPPLSPCFLWCRLQDSNPRPSDYKSDALPAELSRPMRNPVTNRKLRRMQAGAPHLAEEVQSSGLAWTASLPRTCHICCQDSPVRRECGPPEPSRLMI